MSTLKRNRRNRFLSIALLATLFLLQAAIASVQVALGQELGKGDEHFSSFVRAVAAAENHEFELSLELWSELIDARPTDLTFKFNYALTALEYFEFAGGRISNKLAKGEELQKLRYAQAASKEKAKQCIEGLKRESFELSKLAFIESQFKLAEAVQVSPSGENDKLKPYCQEAARLLGDAIEVDPSSALLAVSLNELIWSISDDELERKSLESLIRAWTLEPRNLYLVVCCGERLFESKDSRLAALLNKSLEVVRPYESTLAKFSNQFFEKPQGSLRRTDVKGFVAQCVEYVESQNWSEARYARVWFNMLRGCPGFYRDVRSVRPDALSMLDLTFLNRFGKTVGSNSKLAIPAFTNLSLAGVDSASAIAWYDHDLDLDFELLVATNGQLVLYEQKSNSEFEPLTQLKLDTPVSGILIADLFEVGRPERPQAVRNVPNLVNKSVDARKQFDYIFCRHDTFQEIILWGAEGIRVVSSRASGEKRELFNVEKSTGLESIKEPREVVAMDIDSDGDLDLAVAKKSGVSILQNNGDRTFRDISMYSTPPVDPWQVQRLVACDFDRDLDQDIVVLSDLGSGVAVLENTGHTQFRYRELASFSKQHKFNALDFADIDGNRSWDWIGVGDNSGQVVTTHRVAPNELAVLNKLSLAATGDRLAIGDLNNDGLLDLVCSDKSGVSMYLGTGMSFDVPVQLQAGSVDGFDVIDCDQNGGLDIACIADGNVHIMLNNEPPGSYVAVRTQGNNNANGSGRINHYAIGSTIEVASENAVQSTVVRKPVVHFGLGFRAPTNLRIIFDNGFTQNATLDRVNLLREERQKFY